MSDITIFSSGTKAKASEVNTNFQRSFYQGGLLSNMNYGGLNVTDTGVVIKSANSDRYSLLIKNNGATNIYIGDVNVSTINGFEVLPRESIYIINKGAVHGIGVSASTNIRFLEVTK